MRASLAKKNQVQYIPVNTSPSHHHHPVVHQVTAVAKIWHEARNIGTSLRKRPGLYLAGILIFVCLVGGGIGLYRILGPQPPSVEEMKKAHHLARLSDVNELKRAIKSIIVDNPDGFTPTQRAVLTIRNPFSSEMGLVMTTVCKYITESPNKEIRLPKFPLDPLGESRGVYFKNCEDFESGYEIQIYGEEVSVYTPLAETKESM